MEVIAVMGTFAIIGMVILACAAVFDLYITWALSKRKQHVRVDRVPIKKESPQKGLRKYIT